MLVKWIVICLISIPAWGYNLTPDFLNGFYWANLPIDIVVMDENISRKNALINLSQMAISEWEDRTGLSLWNLQGSGSKNIIRWSTNFASETKMDPNSVLAIAIRYTNGPYFAKTEIVINGNHWLNQDSDNLRTTLTHELGHTLGLDHSNNFAAIMAPTLQDPYNGLHPDDISGMKDAVNQTENRQLTRYVSPLAYTTESKSSQPLSCGTVGINNNITTGPSGLLSLGIGILIGFVRKVLEWFKSHL